MLKIKRIYEPLDKSDGFRIFVDRLWARGLSKKEAKIDLWLKDVAPSNDLRKWFAHDPEKWSEFKKRYFRELKGKSDSVNEIKKQMRKKDVTLIYGAKDTEHNNAMALKEYLKKY